MKYKDYEGFTKPYVIVHNTGFGTQESNYEEVGPVGEADTFEEAQSLSKSLLRDNNSVDDIESTWCYNTYHININTLTVAGKEMYNDFQAEVDDKFKHVQDNPELYNKTEIGGFTYYSPKNNPFDN